MQVFIWLQFLYTIAENGFIYVYWACVARATAKLKTKQAQTAKKAILIIFILGGYKLFIQA